VYINIVNIVQSEEKHDLLQWSVSVDLEVAFLGDKKALL
jgi:hypothetical protein